LEKAIFRFKRSGGEELMGLVIFGLVNSAILAVTAIGFSLTFGVSGIANFAYGGVYILGAYICWGFFNSLDIPYFLAVILALATSGVVGLLIYWLLIRLVRGIMLSEAIGTFALGIAILEFLRWKGFVGFNYNLPAFIEGSVEIGGIFIDTHRLVIIGVAVALVILLQLFTHYTRYGLACRGISQEERTAISLGINSDWIAALSLALGAILATLAAVVIFPTGTLLIDKGYDVLVFALAVGIVGGLESTLGVVVASFILGFAQTAVGQYIGTQWTMVTVLVAIFVVLIIKPSGMFGKFKELGERV
jgi:branched-chain amino acid transport system permease protein